MALKLPNIIVRILAGAVFVVILLIGILFNQYLFAAIFSLITALALYEFYTLMGTSEQASISKELGVVAGIILFLSVYAYTFHSTTVVFAIYILLVLSIFVCELYFKKENPIQSLAYIALGQLYIAVPFALTNYLVANSTYQYIYLLAIFVFIWVNDSFAYLTGMAFGKRRLFERISPKKSWEGFIGGACFSVGISVLFAYLCPNALSIVGWIGFAIVTIAFGTWGDLIESLMKRTLKVKDSGNIIPGHGGILDRMDSTIFAIPAVVAYLCIIDFFTHTV